jgi:hypothetical protein
MDSMSEILVVRYLGNPNLFKSLKVGNVQDPKRLAGRTDLGR